MVQNTPEDKDLKNQDASQRPSLIASQPPILPASQHLSVSFEDVTLRVDGSLQFEGTNWTMASSQHWAIIGGNGSGMSILADAVCRRIPIFRGQIRYYFDDPPGEGRTYLNPGEIHRISNKASRDLLRRYAGYHQARWQSFEGEDAPTVSEFLIEEAIPSGFPSAQVTPSVDPETCRALIAEVAGRLGISYLLDRNLIHLSNGEGRKVLMARALMAEPKMLILDDPFSGLDTDSRETFRNVIETLFGDGRFQVLTITSREDEIPKGTTHLLRVEGGRIVAQGPKEEVLKTAFPKKLSRHQPPQIQSDPSRFPLPSVPDAVRYNTLVEMENTSVVYHGTAVLSGINWRMGPGENWALLGHNGAGKTTLLSLILGDNPQAYANRITLFDRLRGTGETIWDIKRRIGFVSPELQLFYKRDVTGMEVVCSGFFDSVGLYRTCSPEQEEVARRWLGALEIEALASRQFSSLSAGEQRVVLLARALVKNPVLLVLDEPCQGLDSGHRKHILYLLDQLCRERPVSMIFVTHHADEMPKVITHVLRLAQGHIVECGKRKPPIPSKIGSKGNRPL